MWTRPDWEIYGSDGKTLMGRGSSLAAAREDMKYRAGAQWRHMQGMGGLWARVDPSTARLYAERLRFLGKRTPFLTEMLGK